MLGSLWMTEKVFAYGLIISLRWYADYALVASRLVRSSCVVCCGIIYSALTANVVVG